MKRQTMRVQGNWFAPNGRISWNASNPNRLGFTTYIRVFFLYFSPCRSGVTAASQQKRNTCWQHFGSLGLWSFNCQSVGYGPTFCCDGEARKTSHDLSGLQPKRHPNSKPGMVLVVSCWLLFFELFRFYCRKLSHLEDSMMISSSRMLKRACNRKINAALSKSKRLLITQRDEGVYSFAPDLVPFDSTTDRQSIQYERPTPIIFISGECVTAKM